MLDWRQYVRQNLKLSSLPAEDEANAIDEIAQQLQDAYRDALDRGVPPSEALEQAKLHIPDWNTLTLEVVASKRYRTSGRLLGREVRPRLSVGDIIGSFVREVRYATRRLIRSVGFTSIATITLGLGIGGNTVIFSAINSLLLNPIGLKDPHRILALGVNYQRLNVKSTSVSIAEFLDIRDSKDTFASSALGVFANYNYAVGDFPERLSARRVTWQWFDVFGVKPILGRPFTAEEDQPNVNRVIILDYRIWQRVFGGDPAVIGRTIQLNQQPFQVIGVMGPEFRQQGVNLWTPLGLPAAAYTPRSRFNESYDLVARLKPGISHKQAVAKVRLLTERVRQDGGDAGTISRNSGWSMTVQPYPESIAGDLKSPMFILMGAVGFVLLIACANVAGLMMARAAVRRREFVVRRALGAGPWHLIQQTLTESLIIAGGGVLAGTAIAYGSIPLLLALAPSNLSGASIRPDATVMAFTAALGIVTAILFGMIPALQIAANRKMDAIKESGRSGTPTRNQLRFRSALVTFEIALALVLLVGAGLFLRSLSNLQRVDTGFESRGVMTGLVALPPVYLRNPEKMTGFHRTLLDRLAAEPGVTRAATGIPIPFVGDSGGSFIIEGRPDQPGQPGPHGRVQAVSPDYFSTLRIPLLRGRAFSEQDTANSEPVAVIDENLARQFWPNEDPIGKRIRRTIANASWARIVGIVGHVKHSELASDSGTGVHYYPIYQATQSVVYAVLARTTLPPDQAANIIREAVRTADPSQSVFDLRPMEGRVLESVGSRRFAVQLLVVFAVVGGFMAAIGLYGVMSYVVTQRTQEIGIRMALGAHAGEILALVLRHAVRITLAGIVLGSAGAFVLARLLSSQLFQVHSFDPATFGLMAVVAALISLLACIIPARHASAIGPFDACRYE
jgi:predicted permease